MSAGQVRVVAITDDTGTLITQQRYLPFGAERTDVGTIAQTDFGFTSQRDLDEGMGGLMDYRARFYSPYLNRFLQPDSLIPDQTNPQAWNRFSYVVNRPINLNDPTGHCFSGAVIDTIACISVFVGAFFIFNGTSDSYQPNLSAGELESRQASVNLGVGITVSGLSVKSLAVEALSNIYDCATGAFCGPESLVPGSVKAYDNIPVTNPYPKSSRFVRLVPEDIAEEIASGNLEITLSHPGKLDSYISAAEDLGNYRTQVSVANRLSLPSDSLTKRNALVTFKYDLEIGLIASPINRTYPEFVGRGRTGGGAREWVIPNLPIKKLPINDIRIRRLE